MPFLSFSEVNNKYVKNLKIIKLLSNISIAKFLFSEFLLTLNMGGG